jgi:hypothetical protein
VIILKVKNEVFAIVLAAVILVSTLFASLPLVRAVYTVDHASFPPDLPGDATYDGKVDGKDLTLVARAFGTWFGGGGLWNARADLNDDGKVDGKDTTIIAGLFGKGYDTSATPIAYSTSFEFDVPNTGVSGVWYYILARIYMPYAFTSNTSFLVGTTSGISAHIENVIIDTALVSSGECSGQFNMPLGQLRTNNYHLLELSFSDYGVGGSLNFSVVTSAGEVAWLDRFRVCVPNYSSSFYNYSISTTTFFPSDTYYLGGHADKYINDIWIDGTYQLWRDWEWDMGSYGSIYGWGDGFMYPLSLLDGVHALKFKFWNNATGLLDFQYLSQSNEHDKIGKPGFYAEASTDSHFKAAQLYAGSMWYNETNPGESKRYILTEEKGEIDFGGWGGKIGLGLGIGWAWLTSKEFPDFGVMLNLSYISGVPGKSSPDYIELADSFEIYVPEQAFNTGGIEYNGAGQSIVNSGWTIVERSSTSTLALLAAAAGGPLGAVSGIVAGSTIDAVFDYAIGQGEAGAGITNQNTTYMNVGYNLFLGSELPFLYTTIGTSNSHLLFIKLNPMSLGDCGAIKIVNHAIVLFHVPDGFGATEVYTTICFPWFVPKA